MGKNAEIRLVGQPVIGQVLGMVNRGMFEGLVREHKSDRYYKAFKTWTHFVTMMFGILSRCDSMAETCEGMRTLAGKLNHLGIGKAPAKSSAGDGLRNRSHEFFEALYYRLLKENERFLSVSRIYGLTLKDLFIIDSTTIRLFSDILKGVGRNPKNDGRKKGGLKVHMLIDAVHSVAKFVLITPARVHDKNFLAGLKMPEFSMLVFDKAYNYYQQFAEWTDDNIWFVTRQKSNAVYEVLETRREIWLTENKFGVWKEELIEVTYGKKTDKQKLQLRRICYRDEKRREYVFISNNMEITAEEIALIYKKRWGIELLFKKMKQNFQLHYFYGENENAIRTQVWCTLIAQLLLTVLQNKASIKKAFSTVATLVRINLVSLLDVHELLRSTSRDWNKNDASHRLQPSLFPT
jgi:hypothetical protein